MTETADPRRRTGLNHISGVLERLLRQARLYHGVVNYGVLGRWPSIVGAHLAERTRPLRVQNRTLWVYVDNATLLHHLTFLAPRFLQRIREETPETTIDAIRFTLNPEV